MPSVAPPDPATHRLDAPRHWRSVGFISDLHLHPQEPATLAAWQCCMADLAVDALFILGDLFDAWVGDDILCAPDAGFERDCASVLRAAAARCPVFFMHGNRDFLIGPAWAADTGVTLLPDPTRLHFARHHWLLSHGDALCIDDIEYIAFRKLSRTSAWQQQFLARPLAERQQFALDARAQSEQHKRGLGMLVDVDAALARDWLQQADCPTLIHGHTHQPAAHDLGHGRQRIVLSDWDAAAQPPRGQLLRIERDDGQPRRVTLGGA